MQCPSCENTLKLMAPEGVRVHVCADGCGSLWFARKEVLKLEERPAGSGRALLEAPRVAGVRLFRDIDHICPHCTGTLLYRHCFSRRHEFEIDQCSRCGGFWVDTGLLADAAAGHPATAPPTPALQDYFQALFRDRVAHMNQVNHDTLEAAQQIVRIFSFLCPPAWLPGEPPVFF